MASSKPQLPAEELPYDPKRPLATVKCLYNYSIPNVPGKSIVAYIVTLPPNGSTPPHNHAGAFVSAHILSGHMINAMDDKPRELFEPGMAFSEHPGCFHRISDNASETESASFFATLVLDTETVKELGVDGLTVIDEKYLKMIAEAQSQS